VSEWVSERASELVKDGWTYATPHRRTDHAVDTIGSDQQIIGFRTLFERNLLVCEVDRLASVAKREGELSSAVGSRSIL
jgi:hypothetical protein